MERYKRVAIIYELFYNSGILGRTVPNDGEQSPPLKALQG